MNLTNCTVDVTNITNLSDAPSISSSDLKAKFDKTGKDLKDYINDTLIEEIETGLETAENNAKAEIKATYKYNDTLQSEIEENGEYTLTNSYTVGTGNLDVLYEGELLVLNEHYEEVGTSNTTSTKINFKFKVPENSLITCIIRK